MRPNRTNTPPSPAELARRYQAAVDLDPDAVDLDEADLLAVVAHYRRRTMLDEGLRVADRGLTRFPFSVRLYLAKAKILAELHVYEYALEVLEQAAVYDAEAPQIRLQRAPVLAGLGREADAFAELDALGDLHEDDVLRSMRALSEALVFEQLGRNRDVYYFLGEAIRAYPDNEEAFELLWISTEVTANHAATEALCEEVLQRDAYHARAWYNLGHARYALGKTDEALVALEYAYIIDPHFELAYREAGEICYEQGRYAQGVEVYETLMEYVSADNEVLLRLGQCYLHEASHTQARLCINRVLGRDPGHDEALYYSGLCYLREENWRAAANAFRRAIAANDHNELYHAGLADALVQLGDLARAERYYARAAETAPELPEHWLRHAVFLYETGRALEALRVLDEAEEHTVGHELAFGRVVVLLALGREAQALRHLAGHLEDPEAFAAHAVLFEIAPQLAEHDLVRQVIRCFA